MASQGQPAKVLRIGIIQDGKIVQERLIKAGETVNVGESAKNTFVLPKTQLPRAEFPLFVAKGGQYHLNFTDKMKGKISSGGAVVGFDKLRKDPSVSSQGGVWRLPLTESDRGKIGVDGVTVLFQFVPPPPVQAVKPMEGMDFRPLWVEEDDPAFFGFLALWTALGGIFALFVWLAPEPAEITFADVEDRFAKLIVPEKPEIDQQNDVVEDPDADRPEREVEKEAPDESKAKAKAKPKTAEQIAAEKEAAKQALKAKIKVAKIGTRGKSSTSTSNAYESGVLGELDKLQGGGIASEDELGGPRKGDVDSEDVRISDLKSRGASATEGTAGPGIDFSKYAVSRGEGDLSDVEGAASVEAIIERRSGQLQYCYEEQLRADPSLSGKVEVSFNVAAGRVTTAGITQNSTGNDRLGDCIAKKVKRWRFDTEVNGPVRYSFFFRKKS